MVSNNTGRMARFLAQRYYPVVGHLFSPGGQRGPVDTFPYALDNGCFTRWDPKRFINLLDWASSKGQAPKWVCVPDVVGNPTETLARWRHWAPYLKDNYEIPLALAVQDKVKTWEIDALRPRPDLIFVGGHTRWKWETAAWWCREYPRVHIGRVNQPEKLWRIQSWGAESCDGTGWFRGDRRQLRGLVQFLRQRLPERFKIFDAFQ